ncbi:hypothetical protein DSCA_54520 [Desulfosarcina alkanivorans]|uniref:Uncharacterized protein n=1 Tax=Desulfosarcina alkanivorans TaxID=571177 RepID=A0A5K7YP14_9BACT|nr:hypothetical protein DSCA_54520 [Desulfosarcina alkanivorans]
MHRSLKKDVNCEPVTVNKQLVSVQKQANLDKIKAGENFHRGIWMGTNQFTLSRRLLLTIAGRA